MPDANKLIPADPSHLADAIAYALRFQGRKRVHSADEIMSEIVAKRLVEHLERAGFVIVKRPPEIGAAALRRWEGDICHRARTASRLPEKKGPSAGVMQNGPLTGPQRGRTVKVFNW